MKSLSAPITKSYLQYLHTLSEPVEIELSDDKTETRDSIIIKPFDVEKNIKILPSGDKLSYDDQINIASACTGWKKDELEELTTQDWLVVVGKSHDYYTKTSYELELNEQLAVVNAAGEKAEAEAKDAKALQAARLKHDKKVEAMTEAYQLDASKKTVRLHFANDQVVTLKPPKLKVSRLAEDTYPNIIEQRLFILSNITDLSETELRAMPLPDYRSLNEVVHHFLHTPADS